MSDAQGAAASPLAYLPALDGLRAIAVLLVLAYHARVPFTPGGFIGVDLFFVLSGFLITRLLFAEQERSGGIDVGRFYLRRLRRLYPALLLMLAAYLLVAPRIWPEFDHARDALLAGTYVANWSIIAIQAPVVLSHTWSLAVEEQFYLLWPLLITWLPRQHRLRALVVLFLVATLWRVATGLSGLPGWAVYLRFDTRLSGMVLGACIAALPVVLTHPRRWVWAGLIAVAAITLWARWLDPAYLRIGITFSELAAAVLIVGALQHPGGLAHPALAWIGRLSYGMYLWHYPLMRAVRDDGHWATTFVVGTLLSILLAWLSYVTVERWLRVPRAGDAH